MSTHKAIDRICAAAAALTVLLAVLFVNGEALGLQSASRASGYEARLFDTARVHTIDIVMDGWEAFLESCENEEYAACAVVIDGESYQNVGLRAKGNTSLSTVSALGSDRYSFKLEFDQYESGKSYYGLDKLCLNNLIQDNTCMKDYLTYCLMDSFGVAAPLCSYVYITVNGEDWGLYLAVEGVEDGFLRRNYGGLGALYKPDSMGFGGGRGNGRAFDMGEFMGGGDTPPDLPEGGAPAGGADVRPGQEPGGMGGGMGSSDVKLQYTDDNPDSYANIFDNAKTSVTAADEERLIGALKILSEGQDVERALDVDAVLRYFAVHNFVCNSDSYTGDMVHNYYLYERDGQLSMIPWDYNLAFGTFRAGDASGAVNDPIDSPLSVTGSGDRPMIDWIFSSEVYTELYHQYLAEFLETVDCGAIIAETGALIAPYVERDPTKFCSYEEFEAGVEALTTFCALRAESVSGQLAGTIPSTGAGQSGSAELVDASGLDLSAMGTMDTGGGAGGAPAPGNFPREGDGPPEMPGQEEGAVVFSPQSMPGSPGAQEEHVPGAAVLLGISIFVLLAGLAVALKFR